MSNPSNVLFRLWRATRQSIAFYPVLISIGYVLVAAAAIALDSSALADRLRAVVPSGLTSVENARSILSTLVTGVVSLVVFSFSMVMVVLNGAAARLTPRVLPRLISDTRNRIILGIYLGTILYLLMLMSLLDKARPTQVPILGVLLSLVFGMACMALFVVFIRSISQSIQVDWVVSDLYRGAHGSLDRLQHRLKAYQATPDDSHWFCLDTRQAGYLRNVNERQLSKLLCGRDLIARLQVEPGFFLHRGHPLIRLSAPLSQEDVEEVLDCFDFHDDEMAGDQFAYGLRQISEVAVKAISPAINDPGTAVRALNLIAVILDRLAGTPPVDVGCFDQGRPRLYYRQPDMRALLRAVIAPIRTYGRHDPQVGIAVLQCLKQPLHRALTDEQLEALWDELQALRHDLDEHLGNPWDRRAVNEQIERIDALRRASQPALEPLETSAGR
ncbi:DUF2254 domain-containing protein [Stutzerimonas urumqiensis]|uniref:DUF2254 domain-containing protein n=1 Tax=Stutzerimonas urumqiensis TaxID=638269 RepID=UPI000EB3542D|nr:DUF2254 domain-containing protein [Stutzerimonas urumqiensis]